MNLSENVPVNINTTTALCILVGMMLIIIGLLIILFIQHRRLNDCRYVIVRLINEKEELKDFLPPESPVRYLPYRLTKTELLSVVKMINHFIKQMPDEVVEFTDTTKRTLAK